MSDMNFGINHGFWSNSCVKIKPFVLTEQYSGRSDVFRIRIQNMVYSGLNCAHILLSK